MEYVNPYTIKCIVCGRSYDTVVLPAKCPHDDCEYITYYWGWGEGPIKGGSRVEIHPGYDLWMRGDMYGEVKYIKDDIARVKMGITKKIIRIKMEDLKLVP